MFSVTASGMPWGVDEEMVLQPDQGPVDLAPSDESPSRDQTAIRSRIECALIIQMVIQTTGLHPSGSDQIDAATNVSREDATGSVQLDAEHLSRNRKVVGSNPTSGSTTPQVRGYVAASFTGGRLIDGTRRMLGQRRRGCSTPTG
jgi:hypothetical protein